MIWNTSKLSASHLSRARATFVVDGCQFGPCWIYGLKMELMACANLVGSTTEQSFLSNWPFRRQCFISLILIYRVRKNTAFLRCIANQFGTGHKLHFQPKNPARAKLAAINNKNGCGTAEVWCRHFGSVSYNWYNHINSGKRYIYSFVPQLSLHRP